MPALLVVEAVSDAVKAQEEASLIFNDEVKRKAGYMVNHGITGRRSRQTVGGQKIN